MAPIWYISSVCLTLSILLKPIHGYFVTVDAHSEECFFDKVEIGTKMGLMFEISEGGFLDIDVRITAPDGNVIYQGERESSGKYTFTAQQSGMYTYCFSNQMSTMTPKVVMFNMEVISTQPSDEDKGEKGDPNLQDMIRQLGESLTAVKHEQEYMSVRDRIHRSINESTNSRVVWWSFFEAIVLVTMTIGQIYYLKRFFEVRRVV
ncbi:hypothetical protein WDU94_010522 [Cyamophila willieti]